jgi:hypothetical protein
MLPLVSPVALMSKTRCFAMFEFVKLGILSCDLAIHVYKRFFYLLLLLIRAPII